MTKIKQGCGVLALACALGATGIAPAQAQSASEIVLQNFGALPRGAIPYAGVIRDSAGNLYGITFSGGTAGAGVVYKLDAAGRQTVLYSFKGGADGANPNAGVIGDPEGNLYGTTPYGGTANQACPSGCGVVYKLDTTGRQTVLYSFTGGADGANPNAGVIRDPAGNLYGTTSDGGTGRAGVVFKLDAAGQETVLYSFTDGADGGNPYAGLIRDSAGSLYGTAYHSGTTGWGVVFKLDTTGQYTVLYTFTGGADGGGPETSVIRDSAGNLYGTTCCGGTAGEGVVYKLDVAGRETVLHTFTGGADGGTPESGVIRDSAGNLYGTTQDGGTSNWGIVYKLDTGGQETVLHTFTGGFDWDPSPSGVIRDSAGNLYGTTSNSGTASGEAGYGAVYELDAMGHETVLYNFAGPPRGANPWAGVIGDSAGNFYGTTYSGGTANAGVVYKLDTSRQETVLHTFTGGADGSQPFAGVIRDSAGNLYGTTFGGGTAGFGVVYKLDTAGEETVLYNFTGGADGGGPHAGVIRDSAGNLYGTTYGGGSANFGVVYKLDATGQETVLYSFTGGADGGNPYAGLIRDPAGNLYGTTVNGGTANAGVVYKLEAAGQETVLYSFTGGVDGRWPFAGVIRDLAGNLYGTTVYGGTAKWGVVFKLDTAGQETVLYSFTGGADGANPYAGVIRDSAGNFYGTAELGGTGKSGVVYKLDTAGQETVLHSFTRGADGGLPYAGVIRDSAGNLYGTTEGGGKYGGGVVFRLKPQ